MSASLRVCPICARPVAPRAENPASPFCSPACKLVDLGRWLDGDYRLPQAGSGEPGDAGDDFEGEGHQNARGDSFDAD